MIYVLTVIAVEFALLAAGLIADYLGVFVMVNMLAIMLYAPQLFDVAGWTNNVGAIFYSFVLLAMTMIVHRNGTKAAVATLSHLLYVIVAAIALSAVVLWAIDAGSDLTPWEYSARQIIDSSYQTAVPSLAAFFIATATMIAILQRRQVWWSYVVAIIVAQVLDSVVFYPLAFSHLPLVEIAELTWTGVVFKCAVSVVAAGPVIMLYRAANAYLNAGEQRRAQP